MDGVEFITAPGIAAIVFALISVFGAPLSSRWKPPIAGFLGVGWAVVAFVTVPDAYPSVLAAVAVGITAGAAASGLDSYRFTYRRQGGQSPGPRPSPLANPTAGH